MTHRPLSKCQFALVFKARLLLSLSPLLLEHSELSGKYIGSLNAVPAKGIFRPGQFLRVF